VTVDVLVIAPFRRPTFRQAISNLYPTREPWDSPPLTVAGALEQSGLTVGYLALQNILDAWDRERDLPTLLGMLAENPSRMVIFASDYFIPSRSTATLFGMRVVSQELRELPNPPAIGVVGRLATTAAPVVFDQLPECDFLVHGEPEHVIGEIAATVLSRGVAATTHPSLVTRATLQACQNPIAATSANLDDTALPAWHLLGPSLNWWDKTHPTGTSDKVPFSLRTSAGCRFRCRFCAGVPNWLDYRTKSAERVAAEVDTLTQATEGRAWLSFLEDEIFTRHGEHVSAVSEELVERGIRVDGVYTHSSMLTGEIVAPLSRMTSRVFLGLDNPDDTILRSMRKGQNLDTVLTAVDVARSAGLGVHLEWIIGSPNDTVDSTITSLNAIVSLLATGTVESINTYVYCPHPGTEYVEKADTFGLKVIDGFEDIQESGGYPASETDQMSRRQVYVAYLMSQLAIAEVTQQRHLMGPVGAVGTPSRAELHRIFDKLNGA
jgi:radical SAM superfamily enzyme YgiQ (UPF0313 family)